MKFNKFYNSFKGMLTKTTSIYIANTRFIYFGEKNHDTWFWQICFKTVLMAED